VVDTGTPKDFAFGAVPGTRRARGDDSGPRSVRRLRAGCAPAGRLCRAGPPAGAGASPLA